MSTSFTAWGPTPRLLGSAAPPRLLLMLAIGLVWLGAQPSGQSTGMPSTKNGDWTHYTADMKGTKYSPLDQINASNFNKLEVAWRFKTDNLGTRPEFKLEGTPLAIKGVLYTTAGTRRSVIALDGKTGELLWSHSYREGNRAAIAPRQLSGRGVSYWTDGKGDERVLYMTTGYRLIALNAKTGQMIPSFGENGVVDLKRGALFGKGQQIDLETGEIGIHSTPTVVKDVIIVGSSFKEGMTVKTHNNTKGLVRAYNVRDGKLLWTFNTIPRPGEFGNDTWENESWAINGNTGVWTQITVDEDLGLVYLPVEDPTSDFYGGHRPGNNLFGDSLVCVDLKTGQRKWHFQMVHHPIWDYDLSSAPILADITVNGKAIKAVAVPSKEAFLYVFDRVTGQPVWPIEERPVPQSDVPGEKTSPTQPFPTKPPAYARQAVTESELIDFTPELREQAKQVLTHYKVGPMFTPGVVSKVEGPIAALTIGTTAGGTNWPGASYDPETHTVYAQAGNTSIAPIGLIEPPAGFSDIRYVAGTAGQPFVEREGPGFGSAADAPQRPGRGAGPGGAEPAAGAGRGGRGQAAAGGQPPAAGGATPPAGGGGGFGLQVQGLPLLKPPYGILNAINLDRGEITWQVPHGDTPDNVRNSPVLKGMNIPNTGQSGSVGLMVTKTLVILGDPQVTTTPDHPRGAMLRAYDKQTGQQVGAVWMPAPQSGSPMTYKGQDGRQYIVISVSGGNYSGEFIAFALPESEVRTTTQGQH
ncbi:MAG TPA: PQQ-binding-like beta-propeller repeat protein [Vicinamibacterales bacterium]|nr:PQQ-binding-like beta-propeller repeat protein [Vicinamibacterales bacterium]